MKRVTIKDVALAASVSITTVSHVVNNTRFVEPDTRQRVLRMMDALGYQPNSLARSLRSGVTKTIGLIVPDASNLFFAEIARKIEDYGFSQGYSVILGNSDNNPDKQSSYIKTLLAKRVDGMIFISSGGRDEELYPLTENHIPVVVADRDISLELADVVMLDNEKAGYEATSHLVGLGHRRIACIATTPAYNSSQARLAGYRRSLAEAGITADPALVAMGDYTSAGGLAAMNTLLDQPDRPSAVFSTNDMMAIGAMMSMRQHGLSVPTDISIVGFDDIELASEMTPALTTMRQPVDDLARAAIQILIERMTGVRTGENQRVILTGSLVLRESTIQYKGVYA
jgi:LacI family transcriptional regulator